MKLQSAAWPNPYNVKTPLDAVTPGSALCCHVPHRIENPNPEASNIPASLCLSEALRLLRAPILPSSPELIPIAYYDKVENAEPDHIGESCKNSGGLGFEGPTASQRAWPHSSERWKHWYKV